MDHALAELKSHVPRDSSASQVYEESLSTVDVEEDQLVRRVTWRWFERSGQLEIRPVKWNTLSMCENLWGPYYIKRQGIYSRANRG